MSYLSFVFIRIHYIFSAPHGLTSCLVNSRPQFVVGIVASDGRCFVKLTLLVLWVPR